MRGKKTINSINYTLNEHPDESIGFNIKYAIAFVVVWFLNIYVWLKPLNAFIFSGTHHPLAYVGLFSFMLALAAGLGISALFFAASLSTRRTTAEYHSCEHKTIGLLMDEKLEPTLENLKKMPRLVLRCGSTIGGAIATWPLIFGAYFMIAVPTVLFISVLIACPLLIQFFLTTAEPSEDKLQEALDVIKKFRNEP